MSETEKEELEIWKVRNLIKKYSKAKGSGTSMITLMIKSGGQISISNQMLTDEFGAASNIKSRVNRQSVQTAIAAAQHKLKTYTRTPPNGLVLLCGIATLENGKEKKLNIGFEPFKKLNVTQYRCDSRFHLEALQDLLVNNDTYGFIIIDGNGLLLANVSGNEKTILHYNTVDLPKKHGRGGQSALRFARLRLEARHNYLTKSNEIIKKHFTKDNKPLVKGIILAGFADFKSDLIQHKDFPYILKPLIIGKLDISYGGENGLIAAIEQAKEIIPNVKLMDEKKIISEYLSHLERETGMYAFGVKDVMYALELGAVTKLIVWDELNLERYVLDDGTDNRKVVVLDPNKINEKSFYDKNTDRVLNIKEQEEFLEWLTDNYSKYGIDNFCLVSDRSAEGRQFSVGFGGFGAILRWDVDFSKNTIQEDNQNSGDEESDDELDEFDDFC